ncbi:hypothetical protein QL285_036053 [Trifolium repens]|nr:hypothetical protein QL285_036053 [Trifolium repens]
MGTLAIHMTYTIHTPGKFVSNKPILVHSNSFSDFTFVQSSPQIRSSFSFNLHNTGSASFNQVSDSFFAEIHPSTLFNLQSSFKIQVHNIGSPYEIRRH